MKPGRPQTCATQPTHFLDYTILPPGSRQGPVHDRSLPEPRQSVANRADRLLCRTRLWRYLDQGGLLFHAEEEQLLASLSGARCYPWYPTERHFASQDPEHGRLLTRRHHSVGYYRVYRSWPAR